MSTTENSPAGRTARKRALAAGALLVFLAAAAGMALKIRAVTPHDGSKIVMGKDLPRLMVRDAMNKPVDLRAIKSGRRRVFAFYSPTCGVCQHELPELVPFPANLDLVMINEGESNEPDPFLAGTSAIMHLSDPDASFRTAFSMPSLPTLIFVDEHNVVTDGLIGAHPPAVAQGKLAAFAHPK
ncbi:MAG TPA: hypothetical protein VII75_12835 [Thermoanaerobaculia bacterium]